MIFKRDNEKVEFVFVESNWELREEIHVKAKDDVAIEVGFL